MTDGSAVALAVDGSEESKRALDLACQLCRGLGASLVIITVVPPPPIYPMETVPLVIEPPHLLEAYQKALGNAVGDARAQGVASVESKLLEGPVVDSIVQFLKEAQPRMLVMGARGLSAGARLFLGSVSDGVVHHAPCPVLIVRDGRSATSKVKEDSA
ncbi:MAG: universal stress protein [Euryarchaeota archaeon]|nr:universal stress protein [Euryarchaeota archaeon]MDE1837126.1 universal stress protein [Euryarchaeota archaeon]MDE1879662.1 universal stress protein [Euryarchaeota archaeon]MDE2045188.1 universal stress protein [Thermoplasmata archaeon]